MRALGFRFCLLILFAVSASVSAQVQGVLQWHGWSHDVFTQAVREKKLVLLHLEAVWCHWCHVMEQETYADAKVQSELSAHYLALKVDQDSRPDLSAQFRDYGWPATIIFDGSGQVLAKRAGFIPPAEFLPLLKKLAAHPVPERESTTRSQVAEGKPSDVVQKLIERHYQNYDPEHGGLKSRQKYLDYDSLEYSLGKASRGSGRDEKLVRVTLSAGLKLLDPVWGGFYQYSVQGDWDHPHFEKLLVEQARAIEIYADAYTLWGAQEYRSAAERTAQYVFDFLRSPDGTFYVSQDADLRPGEHAEAYFKLDDAGRRALGVPRLDTNVYTRENALMIKALVRLFAATGEQRYFLAAQQAADWVLKNRSLNAGGFSHGAELGAGPFLGDTVAMGEALLALYGAGADRHYLTRARELIPFIEQHFIDPSSKLAGVLSSARHPREPLKPKADCEENIQFMRFANLLYQYTGLQSARTLAARSLKFLLRAEVALDRLLQSGILVAREEFEAEPLHITVVGKRGDELTTELLKAALRHYAPWKRTEVWDRTEGPLFRNDVSYPDLGQSAAFICSNQRCSLPVFESAQLPEMIRQLAGARN